MFAIIQRPNAQRIECDARSSNEAALPLSLIGQISVLVPRCLAWMLYRMGCAIYCTYTAFDVRWTTTLPLDVHAKRIQESHAVL